jgi:hypothetical protein
MSSVTLMCLTILAAYKGMLSQRHLPINSLMHLPSRAAALGVAFASLVSANSFALPTHFHRFAARSANITWNACGDNSTRQCGRFEVPLDYQNATVGKASLAVARYPSTNQTKLGTLFLNPGGPGVYY